MPEMSRCGEISHTWFRVCGLPRSAAAQFHIIRINELTPSQTRRVLVHRMRQLEGRGAEEGGRHGPFAVAPDDDCRGVLTTRRLEEHVHRPAFERLAVGRHAGRLELLRRLGDLPLAGGAHEVHVLVVLGAHHERRVGHAGRDVADRELERAHHEDLAVVEMPRDLDRARERLPGAD
jgi:hypothetical protein